MQTEGHFLFDPDDSIYRDHFPGHPVVPGSLIVQAFARVIGESKRLEIERFRFKRFIGPGTYRFCLTPKDDHIECRLFDGDRTVATGTVKS